MKMSPYNKILKELLIYYGECSSDIEHPRFMSGVRHAILVVDELSKQEDKKNYKPGMSDALDILYQEQTKHTP
jgi:hypothetical protein